MIENYNPIVKKNNVLAPFWDNAFIHKNASTGAVASFQDGVEDVPIREMSAEINPVQDLHGYDYPWPAGGGLNTLDPDSLAESYGASYGLSVTRSGEWITISGTYTGTQYNPQFRIIQKKDLSVFSDNYKGFPEDSSANHFGNIYKTDSDKTLAVVLLNMVQNNTYTIRLKIVGYTGSTVPEKYYPYSNICPLSGFNGAEVNVTGKNVYVPVDMENKTISGVTFEIKRDGVHATGTATSNFYYNVINRAFVTAPYLEPGTYTMHSTGTSIAGVEARIATTADQTILAITTNSPTTFTVNERQQYFGFFYIPSGSVFDDTVLTPQIERGLIETSYEPYIHNTYSISFPSEAGTVYGGTLTKNPDGTGKLIVDWAYRTFNGSESWVAYPNHETEWAYCNAFPSDVVYPDPLNSIYRKSNFLASVDNIITSARKTSVFSFSTTSHMSNIYVSYPSTITSLQDWKAYLANNNLQVVYKLASSVTYTIPASQIESIKTLNGLNTFWINTGDITNLVYYTDTQKYSKEIAEISETYENMTVGSAEQLLSSVGVEEKVPYNLRTSGGTADIGNRETDMVVGGTVVWNQYMPNPEYIKPQTSTTMKTVDSDGVITVTATGGQNAYNPGIQGTVSISGNATPVIGHKYYFTVDARTPDNQSATVPYIYASCGARPAFGISGATSTNGWNRFSLIIDAIQAGTGIIYYIGIGNLNQFASEGDRVQFKNVQIYDLTIMFGSAIANYIYSLEQATAGAGVAWFRKLFPKENYEYNRGELMSVNATHHKMVGFNLWNSYNLDTTGSTNGKIIKESESSIILYKEAYQQNKNKYNIAKANTVCHIEFDCETLSINDSRASFKINANYTDGSSSVGAVIVPLVSAGKIQHISANTTAGKIVDSFSFGEWAYEGAVRLSNICINYSWDGSRNGEYEPYVEHVYPLDDSLIMRGIPKLDSDNSIYYDGDTYESNGNVTRRYGMVDLGKLTWTYNSGQTSMVSTDLTSVAGDGVNILCSAYKTETSLQSANWSSVDKVIAINKPNCTTTGNFAIGALVVKDTSYSDAATFKEAMSGVMLIYELATPTTETAKPYNNPQIVDAFGTEEYIVNEQSDVLIPVGHNTLYQTNLRRKIEKAPDNPEGNGDYIVRQTNGTNRYVNVPFPVDKIPTAPTANGTYTLKVTVSNGTATYSWG